MRGSGGTAKLAELGWLGQVDAWQSRAKEASDRPHATDFSVVFFRFIIRLLNSAGQNTWNDDFDRGKSAKSEQLKTKRIGRSRNITSRRGALGTARTTRRQAGTRDGVQKASTIESQNSVGSKRYKFCPDHGGMLGFAWRSCQQN